MNKKELIKTIAEVEEALIIDALTAYEWNVTKAARAIAVSRATMYRKMLVYGIKKGVTNV